MNTLLLKHKKEVDELVSEVQKYVKETKEIVNSIKDDDRRNSIIKFLKETY